MKNFFHYLASLISFLAWIIASSLILFNDNILAISLTYSSSLILLTVLIVLLFLFSFDIFNCEVEKTITWGKWEINTIWDEEESPLIFLPIKEAVKPLTPVSISSKTIKLYGFSLFNIIFNAKWLIFHSFIKPNSKRNFI